MTSDQKKALLLLNSVIFNYHGFNEEEQRILEKLAAEINGEEDLKWVNSFIQEDLSNLFERARAYFNANISHYDKDTKLSYLTRVWQSTNDKGHITEMEAMAILKLAKDWGVQKEFLALIRK